MVSFLTFFVRPGLAPLEAGRIRAKNTGDVVMENAMNRPRGKLVFFGVGAGISALAGYVTTPGASFDVSSAFAHVNGPTSWVGRLFGAVSAMTAATVVSGAVAERIRFSAYATCAFVTVAFVYQIVSGAARGGNGLLSSAGCLGQTIGATVVRALGFVAGLTPAYVVGPRSVLPVESACRTRTGATGTEAV